MPRLLSIRFALVASLTLFVLSWTSFAVLLLNSNTTIKDLSLFGSAASPPSSSSSSEALASASASAPFFARPAPRPLSQLRSDIGAYTYMYESRPKAPNPRTPEPATLDDDITANAPLHGRPPPLPPPPPRYAACSPAPPGALAEHTTHTSGAYMRTQTHAR